MKRYRFTAHILLFTFGLQCTVFAQARPVPAARAGARTLPARPEPKGPQSQETPLPSAPARASSARTPFALKTLSPKLALAATPGVGDLAACEEALLNHRAPLLSVSRSTLWPPNHALVDVGLNFDATAACAC
jgi:hypothetical protein